VACPVSSMNSEGLHQLKERGLDEMRRFLVMFVYL
jgi:hypothetical protein